jgi:capsular polysaccharide biosynthesis protein
MHSLLAFEKIGEALKSALVIILLASIVSMKIKGFLGAQLIDPEYNYLILRSHRSKV